ncbi:MAG: hypothetical protein WC188_11510 [Candidatus Caldatribacteriota bacterium]|jgi:hypothetical protein|nr:hypothetical protein [Patescibacteria group bacterium]
MKLISKEHDYYDSISKFGIDKTCIYIRKLAEYFEDEKEFKQIFSQLPIQNLKYIKNTCDYYSDNSVHIIVEEIGYVFFCGECFIFIHLKNHKTKQEIFAYSFEEVDTFINSVGSKKDIEKYNSKHLYSNSFPLSKENVKEVFLQIKEIKNDNIIDFHHKINCPIIYFEFNQNSSNNKLILNPILKKYEFFKIFDPYSAFQKISSFISGIMGGQCPKMIKIKDSVRLEKHGFDKVTSFRNM